MYRQGFREFLVAQGLPAEEAEANAAMVQTYTHYLAGLAPPLDIDTAPPELARSYIKGLLNTQQDAAPIITSLLRYAAFFGNGELFISMLELIDGAEVMANLHQRLGEVLGEQERDAVFGDVLPPPVGIDNVERAALMAVVISRLEERAGVAAARRALAPCMRDLPPEYYATDVQKYRQLDGIDAYLEWKRASLLDELQQLHDNGQLYYTQPVTDTVLEYVRSEPEIGGGVRQGSTVFVTKIPYQADLYLRETDPVLKRYHYCHCPWAREPLRTGGPAVPAVFCYCSAGYMQKPLEYIFGRELEVEVLESVLAGDKRCRFAIHLPADCLPPGTAG